MYVCVCMCMYVCMYVRMYICMYACMYTCVCVYERMYVCVCMHACICLYTCVYVRTCICMHANTSAHKHIPGHLLAELPAGFVAARSAQSPSCCECDSITTCLVVKIPPDSDPDFSSGCRPTEYSMGQEVCRLWAPAEVIWGHQIYNGFLWV